MSKLFKWGGVPVSLALAHLIQYLLDPDSSWWDFYNDILWFEVVLSILGGVAIYAIIFWIINYLSNWIDRSFVFKNNILIHFLITTVVVIGSMYLLLCVEDILYDWICPENLPVTNEFEQAFRNYLVVNMVVAAFVNSFYNSFVFFERWKTEVVESNKLALLARELKTNSLQAELTVLKLQLDPHFLFNNFSILTQLIQTNKDDALLFLSNLSRVYRYIMINGKKDITTLDEELKFVLNYFHLIKIRQGETIDLIVHIDEEDKKKGIPPVTLQLLIENAIKHNVSTSKQPLTIKIESSHDGFVIVSNNLQPIDIELKGAGVGLANINERYQLLYGAIPQVLERADEFVVRLPLLTF